MEDVLLCLSVCFMRVVHVVVCECWLWCVSVSCGVFAVMCSPLCAGRCLLVVACWCVINEYRTGYGVLMKV